MHIISTLGPDNATKTVIPFVTAKGAAARGTDVDMFLVQEATYLGSATHSNLDELQAPGMPSVAAVLGSDAVQAHLGECIVCEPCATARNIEASDLRDGFTFGGPEDLARQAETHESTVTY
jgi:predicted peroxiredoxin